MSYMNRTFVSATGASQANAEAFIDEIITGIVTNIAEAVKVENERAFIVNSGLKFSFAKYGSSNDGVTITVSDSNEHSWATYQVCIHSSSQYKLNVKIAANNKVFNMKLRNRLTGASSVFFSADHLFIIDDAGNYYYNTARQTASYSSAANSCVYVTDSPLYRCSANMQAVSVVKRLPYQYSMSSTTTLETTQGKNLSEDDIRCGKVSSLIDCSTVVGDTLYPIGNKTYYAIDNNTLIEV